MKERSTPLLPNCMMPDGGEACAYVGWQSDEITHLRAENTRLREALGAASGYLLNAKIDLETGAPKRTAIMTIEGGLKTIRLARAAYERGE